MQSSGLGHERQLADIEAFYANELNVITIRVGEIISLLPAASVKQAGVQIVEASANTANKSWLNAQSHDGWDMVGKALFTGVGKAAAVSSLHASTFQRSLVSMSEPERATLRLADILQSLGYLSADQHKRIRVPLIWNKGDTLISIGGKHGQNFRGQEAAIQVLKSLISSTFGESAAGRETLQAALRQTLESYGLPDHHRQILERYLFGGARWMTSAEATKAAAGNSASPSALRLGKVAGTKTDLLYDWRESLITIAPPGAGKSQTHVLRNLLYLEAPAVVLDIKGEMRDGSAAWRSQHVGPTFVFDPKNPEASLHYNPIDFISNDPDQAWDDARNLADLLVIPPNARAGDSYFEDRARDMITVAIMEVALTEPDDARVMSGVLDRLYLSGDDINGWFKRLKQIPVPQLQRTASGLMNMPDKQREGIFDSARRQLEIWQSSAIDKLTKTSTFTADQLRESNGTLYLCVSLDDVKKFASVLRVIIGQTVNALCKIVPESNVPPVTFFLDELPKLGRMDVIENALDAGRGYSVRLWMFCQNIGQLTTVYPNGDGMIANCAARCYMNPDEDAAQRLAKHLGVREGLLDGHRKPLAEPQQLTGTDFANQTIVFLRGHPPGRLDKAPAYADPLCQARMSGLEPEAVATRTPPVAPQTTTEAFVDPSQTNAPLAQEGQRAPPAEAPAVSPADVDRLTLQALEKALGTQDHPAAVGHAPDMEPQLWPLIKSKWRRWFTAHIPNLTLPVWMRDWRWWATPVALSLATLVFAAYVYDQHNKVTEREKSVASVLERAAKQEWEGKQAQIVAKVAKDAADRSQAEIAREQTTLNREKAALKLDRDRLAADRKAFDDRRLAFDNAIRDRQSQNEVERRFPGEIAPAPVTQPPLPLPAPSTRPIIAENAPSRSVREAHPSVAECDRRAANPMDKRRPADVPGVLFGELRTNVQAAVAACQQAQQTDPANARMRYQLARAFQAMGALDQARPLLVDLTREEYPAAFDNLAEFYKRDKNWAAAETLIRRGAELGDPDAMFHLFELIDQQITSARGANEAMRMLNQAAAAGHVQAKLELSKRAVPGEIARGARELLEAMGRQ